MARLKLTADNMLVEQDGSGRHVAALKQGYDGGWSISADPEPLPELPGATFETREELVAALRSDGHDVQVEPPLARRRRALGKTDPWEPRRVSHLGGAGGLLGLEHVRPRHGDDAVARIHVVDLARDAARQVGKQVQR